MVTSPQNQVNLEKQLNHVYTSEQKLEYKRKKEEYDAWVTARNSQTSSGSSGLPIPEAISELNNSFNDLSIESINLLQATTSRLLQMCRKGALSLSMFTHIFVCSLLPVYTNILQVIELHNRVVAPLMSNSPSENVRKQFDQAFAKMWINSDMLDISTGQENQRKMQENRNKST